MALKYPECLSGRMRNTFTFYKKQPYPEFDKEECAVWPFVKELLETSLLFRELVIDLPDIH